MTRKPAGKRSRGKTLQLIGTLIGDEDSFLDVVNVIKLFSKSLTKLLCKLELLSVVRISCLVLQLGISLIE